MNHDSLSLLEPVKCGHEHRFPPFLVPNAVVPPCTHMFQSETKVQGGWLTVDYLLLITKFLSDSSD